MTWFAHASLEISSVLLELQRLFFSVKTGNSWFSFCSSSSFGLLTSFSVVFSFVFSFVFVSGPAFVFVSGGFCPGPFFSFLFFTVGFVLGWARLCWLASSFFYLIYFLVFIDGVGAYDVGAYDKDVTVGVVDSFNKDVTVDAIVSFVFDSEMYPCCTLQVFYLSEYVRKWWCFRYMVVGIQLNCCSIQVKFIFILSNSCWDFPINCNTWSSYNI